MLELVKQLNDARFETLYRFDINGQHVGYVRPALAEKLAARAPSLLGITAARTLSVLAVNLAPDALTEKLKALHEELAADGTLPKPVKEFTDVRPAINEAPLCQINRNLIFPLGIISRGVHVVMTHENGDFVVARRSNKVFTFRGCCDVPVGGLLPSGKDPWDHVKTEAAEEAGIALEDLKPDGEAMVLGYARNVEGMMKDEKYAPAFPFETDGGTNWDEVFYWTVTIPDTVVPTPRDGEVKSFLRMAPQELLKSLREEPDSWKTNSGVMFLEVLANDPRYQAQFTAEERASLAALSLPDPRAPESRGERTVFAAKTANNPKPPST